ncbi:MAG TPA: porin, partial [Thermoanaerobaculia bacterium]|nr:porin [Thermoanaerobaculia bacterium]
FKVRAGKFKVPVGLERLQSGSDILFVERGFPTNLVPNRDLGIQVHGDLATGTVNYQVGVFNGVPDGASADVDSDSGKDVAARLFFQPFVNGVSAAKNFGFGLAASSGSPSGTVSSPGLASYKTPGQQTFFSYRTDGTAAGTTIAKGDRQRLSPQLSWYTGPFGLLAEWVSSKQELARGAAQAQVESTAWEVSASWVLGGTASYKGVSPKKVFDPASKGWGALELKARAGRQEIDDKAFPIFADPTKSASSAKEWGVGLNWILNRAVKVQLDYENTTFERGAVSGDRPDEKVLLSRFQVSF